MCSNSRNEMRNDYGVPSLPNFNSHITFVLYYSSDKLYSSKNQRDRITPIYAYCGNFVVYAYKIELDIRQRIRLYL